MLNRFSPHIKGMDSGKRVVMRTFMGLVAVQSLCETIRQIHPYGSFKTHPGLYGAKKRQRKYQSQNSRGTSGTLEDGCLPGDQSSSRRQVDSASNSGIDSC